MGEVGGIDQWEQEQREDGKWGEVQKTSLWVNACQHVANVVSDSRYPKGTTVYVNRWLRRKHATFGIDSTDPFLPPDGLNNLL